MEKTTIPEILRTGQVPPVLGACPGAAVALLAEAGREDGIDRFIRSANMADRLRHTHPDNPVTEALAALIERAWAADRSFFRRTTAPVARKNPRRPARARFMHAKQRMYNAYSFNSTVSRKGTIWRADERPEAGNAWSPQWDRYRSVETHPAVLDALERHTPVSLRQLLFHLPTRAEMDSNKLAYFETPGKIVDDIRTVTSPQKYLKRMFPHLRDDEVRDLCAPYMVAGERFGITKSTAETVAVAVHGPRSCMSGSQEFDSHVHPYSVYDYDLGWRVAFIRATPAAQAAAEAHEDYSDELRYSARALVFEPKKVFVRSYRHDLGKYSHASEELEAWLVQQGYNKKTSWPAGTPVRHIERGNKIVMPYIDGEQQKVYRPYGTGDGVLHLGGDGACIGTADNTGGWLSRDDCDDCDDEECPDCGDYCDPDDMRGTGRDGDHVVCHHCAHDNYTRVESRHGSILLPDGHDDIIWIDGEAYDARYADDLEIVWVESADDWMHLNNTFICNHDGERYSTERAYYCFGDVQILDDNIDAYIEDNLEAYYTFLNDYENANRILSDDTLQAVYAAVCSGEVYALSEAELCQFAALCDYLCEPNPFVEENQRVNTDAEPIEE